MEPCTESHTCCWSFLDHCLGADRGLDHQALRRRIGRCTEGRGIFGPSAGLDAEDAEIDGVALRRHNAILADDAILLAAGNNLARQQEQRLVGVVDQDQGVDLVAAISRRIGQRMRAKHAVVSSASSRARPYEAANIAGFGDFDLPALDAFIERDERRCRHLAGLHHREEKEIAAFDRGQDAVGAVRRFDRAAGGTDAIDVMEDKL